MLGAQFECDVFSKVGPVVRAMFQGGDAAAVRAAFDTYAEETLESRLKIVEAQLAANGDWLVGKQVTWVDLMVSNRKAPIRARSGKSLRLPKY